MIRKQKVRRKKDFPVGMTIVLVLGIVFMVRFVKVALANEVGGSLAYIQILNSGMPLVGGTYYDKEAYEEINVTVPSLIVETLGINKIDYNKILSMQLPAFSDYDVIARAEMEKEKLDSTVTSFELDNQSVAKKDPNKKPEVVAQGVRNPNIVRELDQSKPMVLLYNTHSDEAYYTQTSSSRNKDENVIGMTELIAKELEEYYGIATIYDKTHHAMSYNDAYYRSRETVQAYEAKYKSFDMVVDIHRDGVRGAGSPIDHNKHLVTTELNNESLAKIMFVDTRNSPKFEGTHAMNQRMDKMANEIFPGMSRGIRTANRGKAMYNQHIMDNTTLIEVGAESNTPQEAQNSAKYIARLIAEEIHARGN